MNSSAMQSHKNLVFLFVLSGVFFNTMHCMNYAAAPDVQMVVVVNSALPVEKSTTIILKTGLLFDQPVTSVIIPIKTLSYDKADPITQALWTNLGKGWPKYLQENIRTVTAFKAGGQSTVAKFDLLDGGDKPPVFLKKDIVAFVTLSDVMSIKKSDDLPNHFIKTVVLAADATAKKTFETVFAVDAKNEASFIVAFPPLFGDYILYGLEDILGWFINRPANRGTVYFIFPPDEAGRAIAEKYIRTLGQLIRENTSIADIVYEKDADIRRNKIAEEKAQKEQREKEEREAVEAQKEAQLKLETNATHDPNVYMVAVTRPGKPPLSQNKTAIIIKTGLLFDEKVDAVAIPVNRQLTGGYPIADELWKQMGPGWPKYLQEHAEKIGSVATGATRKLEKIPDGKELILSENNGVLVQLSDGMSIKKSDNMVNAFIKTVVLADMSNKFNTMYVSAMVTMVYGYIFQWLWPDKNTKDRTIALQLIYQIPAEITQIVDKIIMHLGYRNGLGTQSIIKNVFLVFAPDAAGVAAAKMYAQALDEIANKPDGYIAVTYQKVTAPDVADAAIKNHLTALSGDLSALARRIA